MQALSLKLQKLTVLIKQGIYIYIYTFFFQYRESECERACKERKPHSVTSSRGICYHVFSLPTELQKKKKKRRTKTIENKIVGNLSSKYIALANDTE